MKKISILIILPLIYYFIATTVVQAEDDFEFVIDGFAIDTVVTDSGVEDGVLVLFTTLPDDDVLVLPYLFSGDPETTEVSARFEGVALDTFGEIDLVEGDIDLLIFDIAGFRSNFGTLDITLSSTGSTPSELIIVDNIEEAAASGDGETDVSVDSDSSNSQSDSSSNGGGGSFGLLFILLGFCLVLSNLFSRRAYRISNQ